MVSGRKEPSLRNLRNLRFTSDLNAENADYTEGFGYNGMWSVEGVFRLVLHLYVAETPEL